MTDDSSPLIRRRRSSRALRTALPVALLGLAGGAVMLGAPQTDDSLLEPVFESCESPRAITPPPPETRPSSSKYRSFPPRVLTVEVGSSAPSWVVLAERFHVTVEDLRRSNPALESLEPDTTIRVELQPRPHPPVTDPPPVPCYEVDRTAVSVGSPNEGVLENGMQIPEDPSLYVRRAPHLLWGSGTLVAGVQSAIARFRGAVSYDGPVVLSQASLREGGPFPPHRSHQSGRDVDIWLPALEGVIEAEAIDNGSRKRPPSLEEIDWFAAWGLVRALADTPTVQVVFLDRLAQARLYQAARTLGVGDEELQEVLQWPRGPKSAEGLVTHSPIYVGRMHVRFECAPHENQCIP